MVPILQAKPLHTYFNCFLLGFSAFDLLFRSMPYFEFHIRASRLDVVSFGKLVLTLKPIDTQGILESIYMPCYSFL